MSVPTTPEEQPKGRNWLVVVAAVVVFCCLCSLCMVLAWALYSYGDTIFRTSALLAGARM